jgi:hypothetical protein
MKRRLHLLLLLLSLTLPINGMAGLIVLSPPCPMEQQGMSMEDMHASCCEDQQQQMSGGKVCKTGHECKSSSMLQVSVIKTLVLPAHPTVMSFASDFLPTMSPSGVWRPPRV